ncbi:sulfate ABC transporter substrate-binding protein [Geobacillus thermoleovorans]|uniref:sulfate ABC transporter substrate-binding protein n=1 Tax=Geobacillus thermoleovorans TaxID=33941 RepID=UPI00083AE98B|nr:sulfate ABC transporter substrate-binding protein [Geobacillus thermoleovorans]ODA16269.1 sulfate ABC transporter substrate-binding protein [Geobacillus thermoleovorans]
MKWKQTIMGAISSVLLVGMLLSGCSASEEKSGSKENAAKTADKTITLTLGCYSTIKDEIEEIIPIFQKQWKEKTGQTVQFHESYQGSGAQALNVINGFEADIVALSLEGDIQKIVKSGLITHDWKKAPYKGVVTKSIVALGVREGNPKHINDWSDLTKKGVQVLFPDPKTSGGAKWDINAIYGAGLKISEETKGQKDEVAAKNLLRSIYQNVASLDKSGEESMSTFDKGVGDVIVTYENELLSRIQQGQHYEIVIPRYTTAIENPVALVDKYVDQHGTRKVAEAFLQFLFSKEAQEIFVKHGFRPVEPSVAEQYKGKYKEPEGLFTTDYLGGWEKVNETIYGPGGVWEQVVSGR